jgi:hypothetical protein
MDAELFGSPEVAAAGAAAKQVTEGVSPPVERRNPSIRPLQSFLLLDGRMQKETMVAFAHDVVDQRGAPPAPPPFAAGLRGALRGEPNARRLRVGYVSSVSDCSEHLSRKNWC